MPSHPRRITRALLSVSDKAGLIGQLSDKMLATTMSQALVVSTVFLISRNAHIMALSDLRAGQLIARTKSFWPVVGEKDAASEHVSLLEASNYSLLLLVASAFFVVLTIVSAQIFLLRGRLDANSDP